MRNEVLEHAAPQRVTSLRRHGGRGRSSIGAIDMDIDHFPEVHTQDDEVQYVSPIPTFLIILSFRHPSLGLLQDFQRG